MNLQVEHIRHIQFQNVEFFVVLGTGLVTLTVYVVLYIVKFLYDEEDYERRQNIKS